MYTLLIINKNKTHKKKKKKKKENMIENPRNATDYNLP